MQSKLDKDADEKLRHEKNASTITKSNENKEQRALKKIIVLNKQAC